MNFGQEFEGKRVVITGASGIFGTWIAKAFAAQGARLCLTGSRENKLRELAADSAFKSTQVILQRANLCDRASVTALCERIEAEWSAPDILINNAGLYYRRTLLDITECDWEEILAVNLTAPLFLTQKLAKLMIKDGIKGSIINIGSGAAQNVQIGGGHYSTSKAALAMLTRALALELAPYGIRVNNVGPGFAPGSDVSQLSSEYVGNMISSIPLGRTSGPEDAPQAIMYLCSSAAAFITGATLAVDGGKSAGTFKRTTAPAEGDRA